MSMYRRDFEDRVRAERREVAALAAMADKTLPALPPLPRRARAPKPETVAFTGRVADGLRRVAEARGETPQALAAAIVRRALEDGSAEEALGLDRAERLVEGQGRRPFGAAGDLTIKQCAVVYLIGQKGGAEGWCGWSAEALARLMPETVSAGNVRDSIVALATRGLVQRAQRLGTAPRNMRLTELGRAVYAELAGDD